MLGTIADADLLAAPFSIQNDTCSGQVLAPAASCTFSLSFSPTAAGAALVFLFKGYNRAVFDGMLGFTGGVMVAASFWSLLAPGIEMSQGEGFFKVIPSVIGFSLAHIL